MELQKPTFFSKKQISYRKSFNYECDRYIFTNQYI